MKNYSLNRLVSGGACTRAPLQAAGEWAGGVVRFARTTRWTSPMIEEKPTTPFVYLPRLFAPAFRAFRPPPVHQ